MEKKQLYRQTTVGYWFCMFVTNSLSRRTVLQINLRQLPSVPLGMQAFQLHKLLPSKGRYHDAADVASGPCVYI